MARWPIVQYCLKCAKDPVICRLLRPVVLILLYGSAQLLPARTRGSKSCTFPYQVNFLYSRLL
ncbi:hypothetical protein WDU94_010709 [Cyamophila willieti]